MSDLYEQIISQRGSLDRLEARIPGFGGYLDKAARRTADRMIRDYLASELQKRINRLAQLENILLNSGGLQYMSETRRAKSKLQLLHDRVKAAAPGYAGLDTAIKIQEAELEKLYSFDEAMLRYLEKIDESLAGLEQAASEQAGIEAAIARIEQVGAEVNEAFSLRETVLTNLGK
jgi:hypothetical protein